MSLRLKKGAFPMCTQYGTLIAGGEKMVHMISIRELRPKLSHVVADIHNKFDRYIITKRGKPEVIMMSIEDYESILETLEIQSDKELMKSLKKAEKEMKEGKGRSLDEINRELKGV